MRNAVPCSLGEIGYSRVGAATTSIPRRWSSTPIGDRLSSRTIPWTTIEVSWASLSAARNSSSPRSDRDPTPWTIPVPSRTWRKWIFPDERFP